MSDLNAGKPTRGLKEFFARFLEEPTREGFREIMKNHLGETQNLDFKESWENWTKMAKHILGLANSKGGCIVVGVSQKADNSFDPMGLDKIIDKAEISNGLKKYLPDKLSFDVFNFAFEESEYPKIKGKKFQLLIVDDSPKLIPFTAMNGGEGIRQNAIYVRRLGETAEASYNELQEVINRRIETQYSSKTETELENNLAELKILYRSIQQKVDAEDLYMDQYFDLATNPEYPKESFEAFVRKLIASKKERIGEMVTQKYRVR